MSKQPPQLDTTTDPVTVQALLGSPPASISGGGSPSIVYNEMGAFITDDPRKHSSSCHVYTPPTTPPQGVTPYLTPNNTGKNSSTLPVSKDFPTNNPTFSPASSTTSSQPTPTSPSSDATLLAQLCIRFQKDQKAYKNALLELSLALQQNLNPAELADKKKKEDLCKKKLEVIEKQLQLIQQQMVLTKEMDALQGDYSSASTAPATPALPSVSENPDHIHDNKNPSATSTNIPQTTQLPSSTAAGAPPPTSTSKVELNELTAKLNALHLVPSEANSTAGAATTAAASSAGLAPVVTNEAPDQAHLGGAVEHPVDA